MLLQKERELIIEYGIKLVESGLIVGTSGNISIFDRDNKLMAITPSGIDYFKISPSDIIILDLEGNIVDGIRKPSSELHLHRIFYQRREDINAIVHTHSRFATTLACLNWDLPPVHYMIASAGLDVRCSKYSTFGTKELAENAFEAMKDRKAVLLANHGMISGAHNLHKAFSIAEDVEYCAELYYRSKSIGDPIILGEEEMKNMMERFKTYGQMK